MCRRGALPPPPHAVTPLSATKMDPTLPCLGRRKSSWRPVERLRLVELAAAAEDLVMAGGARSPPSPRPLPRRRPQPLHLACPLPRARIGGGCDASGGARGSKPADPGAPRAAWRPAQEQCPGARFGSERRGGAAGESRSAAGRRDGEST